MAWGGLYPDRVGRLVLASTAPRFTDVIRGRRMERVALHQGQPYFEEGRPDQAEAATSRISLRVTVTPGAGLLPTPSACEAASAFSSVSNSTNDVP